MISRQTLKQIVERSDTAWGRAFDLTIQSLIVLSLVTYSIETLPDLPASVQEMLWVTEAAVVGVFTVEYLLRLYVADSRFRFVFSFFGLIDLAAILPFFIFSGADLRSLRAVRLIRLFRIFKLVRYSRAIQRMHRALLFAREEIVLYFLATLLMLYLSAVGIYHFEHKAQPKAFSSVFASLWWSVTTLTTVGYGDVYPMTVGGRVFTFFVLMIGLGVVAVPAGILSSALAQARQTENADGNVTHLVDHATLEATEIPRSVQVSDLTLGQTDGLPRQDQPTEPSFTSH